MKIDIAGQVFMVEADNDKSTGGNAFPIIMGKSVINL